MKYEVEYTTKADDDLSRLDKSIEQSINAKISWLSENAKSMRHRPLEGQFKGKYKLVIGDWRVIYSFDHSQQSITIYVVRHRREVYKTNLN